MSEGALHGDGFAHAKAAEVMPDSVRELAEMTRPVQILEVDMEGPLPALPRDTDYGSVYVLVRGRGSFRADATFPLTLDYEADTEKLRRTVIRQTYSDESAAIQVEDHELPRISVVVPTLVQRVEELGDCLRALAGLDYPNFEVIVVDNRKVVPDADPLPRMMDDFPGMTSVREVRPGISAARNTGVRTATGEIVAFTDDDVQVDREWLRAIGARFRMEPVLDSVTGLVLPSELETPAQIWFERYYGGFSGERSFQSLTLTPASTSHKILRGSRVVANDSTGISIKNFSVYGVGAYAAGANMAFRKTTLERNGGFDTALGTGTPSRGGEDLAAVISVLWNGGHVGYEPAAVVRHRHRQSYDELLTLMDGEGVGFTAMLSSLLRNDPRHIFGLASQFFTALRQILGQRARKLRGMTYRDAARDSTGPLFPSELAKREFRAYLRGPLCYTRSRSMSKTTLDHNGI